MLRSGQSPRDIKSATGWEWGADGEPRYEIEDPEVDLLNVPGLLSFSAVVQPGPVKDMLLAAGFAELNIMTVPIEEVDDGKSNGFFDGVTNTIVIGFVEEMTEEQLCKIFLHELQHKIQHCEGFSSGAHFSEASESIARAQNEAINAQFHELERYINNKPLVRISGFLGLDSIKNRLIKYYKEQDLGYAKMAFQYFSKVTEWTSRINVNQMGLYTKTVGEVEARNVTSRYGFSREQRREFLASDTEDIERNEQVLTRTSLESVLLDSVPFMYPTLQVSGKSFSHDEIIAKMAKQDVAEFLRNARNHLNDLRDMKYMPLPRNINGNMYLSHSLSECLYHMKQNNLVIPYFLTRHQAESYGIKVNPEKWIVIECTNRNNQVVRSVVYSLEETDYYRVSPREYFTLKEHFKALQDACNSNPANYILPMEERNKDIVYRSGIQENLIFTACTDLITSVKPLPDGVESHTAFSNPDSNYFLTNITPSDKDPFDLIQKTLDNLTELDIINTSLSVSEVIDGLPIEPDLSAATDVSESEEYENSL